ncbi:hypothetical protein [Oceanobacillus sp. CFH 90083]|uniref:hypothetical protein n=1 Tax=Oceanobacillus sp. CFH 90083 TaxID=2592336 RepID=UPI00128C91FC|nr:hypothetical protein [Oceanobacillus sp. CFH 90083]
MMKPEVLDIQTVDVRATISIVLETLKNNNIDLHAAKVTSGQYLKEKNWIEQHYNILNKVSKYGKDMLPEYILKNINERYPKAKVYGGHEFLNQFKNDFTPSSLEALSFGRETVKFGAGIYGLKLTINSDAFVILNAFHPLQEYWFTLPGNCVLFLECSTNQYFKDVRQNVLGNTNPKLAKKDSIKNIFFKRKDSLGIKDYNTMYNGIHSSPSLIEAISTIISMFSENDIALSIKDTVLGNKLLKTGFNEEDILYFIDNPTLSKFRNQKMFEITEDLNWDEVIKLCKVINNS